MNKYAVRQLIATAIAMLALGAYILGAHDTQPTLTLEPAHPATTIPMICEDDAMTLNCQPMLPNPTRGDGLTYEECQGLEDALAEGPAGTNIDIGC